MFTGRANNLENPDLKTNKRHLSAKAPLALLPELLGFESFNARIRSFVTGIQSRTMSDANFMSAVEIGRKTFHF